MLFQNILATLYIVYIGLLLFISYEMHLVELCCSKSVSLLRRLSLQHASRAGQTIIILMTMTRTVIYITL